TRTAPGEALAPHYRTRVRFPPAPPSHSPKKAPSPAQTRGGGGLRHVRGSSPDAEDRGRGAARSADEPWGGGAALPHLRPARLTSSGRAPADSGSRRRRRRQIGRAHV